jgi:methyl-accepting chemotaxis protein
MQDTTWLAVFSGIVAVTLFLQSFALLGLYRSLRRLSEHIENISKDLMKTVGTLSRDVGETLTSIKSMAEGVQAVSDKLTATSNIVQKRVSELDSFFKELTDAARLEVARIQDVVDVAVRQIEDTLSLLRRSVLSPVNEVNALVRGLRVGLDFFLRRPKTPTATSRLDEEMFIG